jgi:hypothetical protein
MFLYSLCSHANPFTIYHKHVGDKKTKTKRLSDLPKIPPWDSAQCGSDPVVLTEFSITQSVLGFLLSSEVKLSHT